LAGLERRIGVNLVERSKRHCRATLNGTRLADQARLLLSGYSEAIEQAAGEISTPKGLVTIKSGLKNTIGSTGGFQCRPFGTLIMAGGTVPGNPAPRRRRPGRTGKDKSRAENDD
jgi:hypothetical protein